MSEARQASVTGLSVADRAYNTPGRDAESSSVSEGIV